jgi:hypothetical protein
MEKLHEAGGVVKEDNYILRWSDGSQISTRPGKEWASLKNCDVKF